MKTNTNISKIIGTSVIVLLVISLFTSMAIGGLDQKNTRPDKNHVNQPLFFAEIEFNLFEGEGCGCNPLEDILIFAYGLETAHNDSNYTDNDGFCTLQLEIDHNYRVIIEDNSEEYQTIIFDFLVVDDQTFTFHLQEREKSISQNIPLLYNLLQRIKMSTKLLS
ncbi:MAG: hypothetical protein ACOC80_02910 [Petrotogales bacterium]